MRVLVEVMVGGGFDSLVGFVISGRKGVKERGEGRGDKNSCFSFFFSSPFYFVIVLCPVLLTWLCGYFCFPFSFFPLLLCSTLLLLNPFFFSPLLGCFSLVRVLSVRYSCHHLYCTLLYRILTSQSVSQSVRQSKPGETAQKEDETKQTLEYHTHTYVHNRQLRK